MPRHSQPLVIQRVYRPDPERQLRALRLVLDLPEPPRLLDVPQDNQSDMKRRKGRQT